MAERNRRVPSYRLHKPSGQARVIIDGKHQYLGKYGTSESWEKYHQLVTEHLRSPANPAVSGIGSSPTLAISINELIMAYWGFAKNHCARNGRPTDRLYHIRLSMRPLRKLFGTTLANEFGPKKLKAVREEMISAGLGSNGGLNRGYINDHIGIIKRMFRWAVAEELVPVSIYQSLQTLESIRKGHDGRVKESKKVSPAPRRAVTAVLKVVSPQIRAMIELQLLTGMRPDEVTIMRPCDIDRTEEVWTYVPESHKMEHRGIEKVIPLGPKAQEILASWLDREATAYLFSPREVVDASLVRPRWEKAGTARKKKRENGSRRPREHYDDETYCQAVERACKRAGVPKWTPGQLRHNAGTRIRRKYGLEAARLILGHSSAATTEIYAEKDMGEAIRIMREMG